VGCAAQRFFCEYRCTLSVMNQLVLSTHLYDSGPSGATVRETDGSVLSSEGIHVKADNRVWLPEKESRALFIESFILYISETMRMKI